MGLPFPLIHRQCEFDANSNSKGRIKGVKFPITVNRIVTTIVSIFKIFSLPLFNCFVFYNCGCVKSLFIQLFSDSVDSRRTVKPHKKNTEKTEHYYSTRSRCDATLFSAILSLNCLHFFEILRS